MGAYITDGIDLSPPLVGAQTGSRISPGIPGCLNNAPPSSS
jgi:hypothetical protein